MLFPTEFLLTAPVSRGGKCPLFCSRMRWFESLSYCWLSDVLWDGVGWNEMAWNGVGQHGMVWDNTSMVQCGMAWDGVGWHGMV